MTSGKTLIILILTACLSVLQLSAQERLTSVTSYPALQNVTHFPLLKTGGPESIELPFLDDFSLAQPFPDAGKWMDQRAFINNSFGLGQPTFGVATLDMMDSAGIIYPDATVSSFFADALTSAPINLFYPGDTTLYLSFYCQPQGLGDAPEPDDSLVLEFYAPDNGRWYRAWSAPGTAVSDFRIVMVNISDSRFLQDGFRFRFRNYASLAPAPEPSLKVNADHWNLDYIYLNHNRRYNDTIMPDVSLVQPVGSLLLNYTAMPWEHFRTLGISGVKTFFQIHLRNSSIDRIGFEPTLNIQSVYDPAAKFTLGLPADEVKAFETLQYDATFNYGFTSNERDSARFNVTLDLNQTNPDWIPGNDSLTVQQVFTNYYAYDDGSAEAGYGITGEGTKAAKLACRYQNLNDGDSLVAVNIYFNRSFADASRKYFQLAIWTDNNGKPGDLIHLQTGAIPKYNGINEFQTIELDTAQVVPSTYYVGWIQTTADFLNVGFDRQNNHGQDILYNISGAWEVSSFEGSLMIRPVFANKSRKSGTEPGVPVLFADQAHLYPNPASDRLYIDYTEQPSSTRITLMDMQGRQVLDLQKPEAIRQINVGDLPGGLYLILIRSRSAILARQKIMILHD
ncbi:MAG: hypothetical protein A2X22_07755 [Bacteroidetes bacterium GWF2_49_14]|nr:MAG: hypothetical protein A2X22_07755 [Bacteroidetes bacterium GWF2_49_14]